MDSGSLTATGLDHHGITDTSMQIYRHPDAFQHYRKGEGIQVCGYIPKMMNMINSIEVNSHTKDEFYIL